MEYYEELARRLRRRYLDSLGSVVLQKPADVYSDCNHAATAITDLLARAEAAEARVKKLAEAIEREQRRAEKAEKERDAAVSDLETVMAYGGGNLDTCQFCKNGQCYVRGGTKLCLPKWRGKKED